MAKRSTCWTLHRREGLATRTQAQCPCMSQKGALSNGFFFEKKRQWPAVRLLTAAKAAFLSPPRSRSCFGLFFFLTVYVRLTAAAAREGYGRGKATRDTANLVGRLVDTSTTQATTTATKTCPKTPCDGGGANSLKTRDSRALTSFQFITLPPRLSLEPIFGSHRLGSPFPLFGRLGHLIGAPSRVRLLARAPLGVSVLLTR